MAWSDIQVCMQTCIAHDMMPHISFYVLCLACHVLKMSSLVQFKHNIRIHYCQKFIKNVRSYDSPSTCSSRSRHTAAVTQKIATYRKVMDINEMTFPSRTNPTSQNVVDIDIAVSIPVQKLKATKLGKEGPSVS